MEIELKLAVRPDGARKVRAFAASCAPLEGPKRRRVYNVYFDTPDLLLQRHRMALRMRKLGGRWLQTLKTAGTSTGGLHQRGEWEFALPDATLDLSRFADTPLAALKQSRELHTMLKPAFVTDFTRTAWMLEPASGTRIEFALDQGVITCDGRSEPLCEVEIELIEGETGALFDVALALNEALVAQPSPVSKAERGYRLFQQQPLQPVKAVPVQLDASWLPHQALRAVVASCLAHYSANVQGALETGDPEFIHQLRVALRRLRSALRVFKQPDQSMFTPELKWLAGTLGAARDWDVFIEETLPPVLTAADPADASKNDALNLKAREIQSAARDKARAAMSSQRHAVLLLNLMRWQGSAGESTGTDALVVDADVAARIEGLEALASREIGKRHKRLLQDAQALAGLDAEARHQVRIDAKRLRYAVDFFASLFKKGPAGAYLKTLTGIQTVLGEANDAATAIRLMDELAVPDTLRIFARGWFAARTDGGLAKLEGLFKELGDAQRFWRKKHA